MPVEVDDVHVGERARRAARRGRHAEQVRGVGGEPADRLADVGQAPVADPVGEEERRLARVHDHPDVRAGVGEAQHRVAGGAASSRPRRGRR